MVKFNIHLRSIPSRKPGVEENALNLIQNVFKQPNQTPSSKSDSFMLPL